MVIIKILGGLGNQMFQYALYETFLNKNMNVKLDISFFEKYSLHNGYELEKIFGIKALYAKKTEANRLGDLNSSFLSRIKRKLGIVKESHYKETNLLYKKNILNYENVYLEGYWQSYKYFQEIEFLIRNRFVFPEVIDANNLDILKKVNETNSVSIHVRRGDYLKDSKYQGICTKEYYINSINYMNKKLGNPVFFVFSDDIEWVKKEFKIKDVYYIDWNKGEKAYIDMQIMSQCKNNIIANSTFSWWGAWLNNSPNKIICAPNKWLNSSNVLISDIIPNTWIKMG